MWLCVAIGARPEENIKQATEKKLFLIQVNLY